MGEETDGHNNPSRLDRLENIVEGLANRQVGMKQERLIHFRAQALRSENIRILTERSRKTDESFRAMAEAQKAMLRTMDQYLRRRQ